MNLKASLFLFLFSIHNKLKSISAHTYNFILLKETFLINFLLTLYFFP
jgi:hypothetical protein